MNNEIKSVELIAQPIVPAVIKTNIAEVKGFIEQSMTKYQNYVIDDANLKDAMDDYKKLKKVSMQLNEARLNITRNLDNQKAEIKQEFDDVITLITEVTDPMKLQFDSFEENRKEQRRVEVNELIKPLFKDLLEKFVAEFKFDNKWLNKTKKDSEITNEALMQISKIKVEQEKYKNDIQGIKNVVDMKNINLEIKLDVNRYLNQYELNGMFGSIVEDIERDFNHNIKQQQNIKEQQKQVQQSQTEPATIETPQVNTNTTEPVKVAQTAPNEPIWAYTIKVTGFFSKMRALKEFIVINEINLEILEQIEVKQDGTK